MNKKLEPIGNNGNNENKMKFKQFFWFMLTFVGMIFVGINLSGWIIAAYFVIFIFPKWGGDTKEQFRVAIIAQGVITVIGLIIIYILHPQSLINFELCAPMLLCR